MTTLGFTQEDENRLMSGVVSGYTDYESLAPGMVEPSDILEPARGLGRATAKTSGLIGGATYGLTKSYLQVLDHVLGTDLTGFSKDVLVDAPQRLNKSLAPDPYTSGFIGQLANSFFDVGGTFVAGTLAGGPAAGAALLGSSSAYSTTQEALNRGEDPITAIGHGAIEGTALAIGARLPASFGGNVLKNTLVYGPAINTVSGVAYRGLVSDWLKARGFDELSQEYKALDIQSLMVDAVIGGLFGAVGARFNKAADMDAALAAHENLHIEIDTAPGVPVDLKSRNAHTEAVVKATKDLLEDKQVDVEQVVKDAGFTEHPQGNKIVNALLKALDESGFKREAEEVQKLIAEVRARGLEIPEYDNNLTAPDTAVPQPPGTTTKKSVEKSKSGALKRAQEVNEFNYDNGVGYGSSMGYPQKKGTPIAKLFSNFADLKEHQTVEALTKFRAAILERALGHQTGLDRSHGRVTDKVNGFRKGYTVEVTASAASKDVRVDVKRGKEVVAAVGIRRGMIDSIAVAEKYRGKNIGSDLLVWLHKNRIANVHEVPDRSPGFVMAQAKALGIIEGQLGPKTPDVKPESRLNDIPAEAPDGSQTTATKALELVDEEVKKAENDSKGFDAAVNCFLGNEK